MSWPSTVLACVVVIAVSVLGLYHIIEPAWIERTLSAVIGYAVGHGIATMRAGGVSPMMSFAKPPPALSPTEQMDADRAMRLKVLYAPKPEKPKEETKP